MAKFPGLRVSSMVLPLSFLDMSAYFLAYCSVKVSANVPISISGFKWFGVSRGVLAFACCRVPSVVLTSKWVLLSPSVPKFILAFAGRRLLGSVSTSGLPFTSLIVSPSVIAFSSGRGVSKRVV